MNCSFIFSIRPERLGSFTPSENRTTSIILGTPTRGWALGANKRNDSPNCNEATGDEAKVLKKINKLLIETKNVQQSNKP